MIRFSTACLVVSLLAFSVIADEGKCMGPPPPISVMPSTPITPSSSFSTCDGGNHENQAKPTVAAAAPTKPQSQYAQKKSTLDMKNFMPKDNFWSNPWYHISPGKNIPTTVQALIEIPRGSRAKFEVDSDTGLIKLDRVLYNAIHYPTLYGYIPSTMTGDKDPLDILVLCSENVPPLTLIEARVIGVIQMIDGDEEDDKIIAVAHSDPKFAHVHDITQVSMHTIMEIEHFFEDYKRRQGIQVVLEEFQGQEQAYEVIHQALNFYKELKGKRDAKLSKKDI